MRTELVRLQTQRVGIAVFNAFERDSSDHLNGA